jgi:hypothetical protein
MRLIKKTKYMESTRVGTNARVPSLFSPKIQDPRQGKEKGSQEETRWDVGYKHGDENDRRCKRKRDICKGLLASKRTVSFRRKDSLARGVCFPWRNGQSAGVRY